MVYHEIRKADGKIKNYLVYNRRKHGRWVKKSKFIGFGYIHKEKISKLKEEFELNLKVSGKYEYLKKEQVAEIERLKQAYSKMIERLNKEEFERFENSFFTELTYNSNAIEGSSLSLEETSLVINENLVPEGKTIREIYEAKNHANALNFIKSYNGILDEKLVLKLHSIILDGISERFAGRYREGSVRIFGSDARFPDASQIPQLMANLFYWYNKNKRNYHPFELAVIFSTKLVTIHPFVDGNGRVSRLIMNLLLKKKSYPWINIYYKQRSKYLEAVRKANEGDYSLITDLLIKTLRDNLKNFGFI